MILLSKSDVADKKSRTEDFSMQSERIAVSTLKPPRPLCVGKSILESLNGERSLMQITWCE